MNPRILKTLAFTVGLLISCNAVLLGQVDPGRLKALQTRLNQLQKTYNKFPPMHRMLMSGNANAAHLATALNRIVPNLKKPIAAPALRNRLSQALGAENETISPGAVASVNNPSHDYDYSSLGGFTQSETSTALCGNNAVVGYNDSGSFLETVVAGTGGNAFSGVSSSTNRGVTFVDHGAVPPGSDPVNFLGGDPQLGCANSSTFFYAQLFATENPATTEPLAAVAFNVSTDGGITWSDPVTAVAFDGFSHGVDKEWMAVDPANPKSIYISFTDFDGSFVNPACPNDNRTAIDIVHSSDGGKTWGAPVVIDTVCGFADALQGSHVVVGSGHKVYLLWEHFTNFPTGPRELRFTTLKANGKAGAIKVVDGVLGVGDSFQLQGDFRDFLGIDLAVDTSGTASDGTLYVTWDDGRDKIVPDLTSQTGQYAYADVLLRSSNDGGATWGFNAVKVNSDIQSRMGSGHDHYQPGIAVDKTGEVGVCWYDRRTDPQNFLFQRFCGASKDQGQTWVNVKVNGGLGNTPAHSTDALINPAYMGDYDGLTSDFTKGTAGFIGAYEIMSAGANPDIRAFSFQ